jgi:hypothetical protein
MTPGKYALLIYRGDSYKWQFKLWSDTAKTVPLDLTGVTVKAEIRDKPGGNVLGALTCVVTLPNIIDASLAAAETATLTSGVWDLQLTYTGGNVSTVLTGLVTVTMDVTDSAALARAAPSRRLRSVG